MPLNKEVKPNQKRKKATMILFSLFIDFFLVTESFFQFLYKFLYKIKIDHNFLLRSFALYLVIFKVIIVLIFFSLKSSEKQ